MIYIRLSSASVSSAGLTVTFPKEKLSLSQKLLYSEGVAKGRITLPQLVRYACANPARVAGLYPRKGAIQAGADADLVILDPDRAWVMTTERLHGNADYTC